MAGHRRAEATPSFGRLCPAMTGNNDRHSQRRSPQGQGRHRHRRGIARGRNRQRPRHRGHSCAAWRKGHAGRYRCAVGGRNQAADRGRRRHLPDRRRRRQRSRLVSGHRRAHGRCLGQARHSRQQCRHHRAARQRRRGRRRGMGQRDARQCRLDDADGEIRHSRNDQKRRRLDHQSLIGRGLAGRASEPAVSDLQGRHRQR